MAKYLTPPTSYTLLSKIYQDLYPEINIETIMKSILLTNSMHKNLTPS